MTGTAGSGKQEAIMQGGMASGSTLFSRALNLTLSFARERSRLVTRMGSPSLNHMFLFV